MPVTTPAPSGQTGPLHSVATLRCVVVLRDADADDFGFLAEMLAVAADWRSEAQLRTPQEILRTSELARYISGWPRPSWCSP